MTENTGEPMDRSATGTSSGAVWLKGALLDIASVVRPDRGPTVVREWSDSVRLLDPEPVGFRSLFLIGMSWDGRPALSKFGATLTAFTEAGWDVHPDATDQDGESWATARHEQFEVRVYEGSGTGLVTLTGWTPVVYPELRLGQPPFTRSTAGGVLCYDCHGWGVCLTCEGRPYERRDQRCWCIANNAGPGKCVECAGRGLRSPATVPWWRPQHPLHGADMDCAAPEAGHATALSALSDVAQRACVCGEFRCSWRNVLEEEGGRLLARFVGACQGCDVRRTHTFTLARS
ncbi:hypothetical protein [Streptomyces drozdowiczii]|uniref:Uncharacterized protein n=1 Tax=Streptomyces drozdowiczii TaxID=202862 RepID=A0ABY6PKN3_9ACTN|nr:hypothetical protein [Streptomyces drozdowiczii]MCX0247823.1 hypothetical protein [Streptomyces drozdowiczii]UZK52818.1 hypothetical protein NEH16_00660 [Streptomyces drozdowiczii]